VHFMVSNKVGDVGPSSFLNFFRIFLEIVVVGTKLA
jgi:hypothetical protein